MTGLLYLVFCGAVGYFAKTRGRGPIAWFFIALIISPLISAIILLALKNLAAAGTALPSPAQPTGTINAPQHSPKEPGEDVKPARREPVEDVKPARKEAVEDVRPVEKPEPAPAQAHEATAKEAEVAPAVEAAPQAPVAPVPPVAPAAASKCPYCDSELAPGAKFCGNCGAKL